MTRLYAYPELRTLIETLLGAAGLDSEKSAVTARILVEADLLGHDTHGVALCPRYVDELLAGAMTPSGDHAVLADAPAAALWDGKRLPGPWLVENAIAAATGKASLCGSATIAVRHSHHTACLAAFLEAPARAGFLVTIATSDPAIASVAPFGGTSAVTTPNPLAIGYPTDGDPVMIDVSSSITTNARSGRAAAMGERLPGPWLIGADGAATDDPAVLTGERPGALLPAGGLDHGHKGYALGLMVEALTQGLAGYGRSSAPTQWGAVVTVQAFDPRLFGGLESFTRETGFLAAACRAARPAKAGVPVRLPGEAGLVRKAQRLRDGVPVAAAVARALSERAERLGVALPGRRSP